MSIYGIGLGQDFIATTIAGFQSRYPDPLDLAQISIIANSSRTAQNLETAFLKATKICPRIFTLDGFLEDARVWPRAEQTASTIEQVLDIAALISEIDEALLPIDPSHIYELSFHLVELLNACAERNKTPEDLLAIAPEPYAEHWRIYSSLFQILLEYWNANQERLEAFSWVNSLQKLDEFWEEYPPRNPIYVVGSTGSRPKMRHLMASVLQRAEGGIILPDFDFHAQEALGEDHPQFGAQNLLGWLCSRDIEADVSSWHGAPPSIAQFLNIAMAPPPYTEIWLDQLDVAKSSLIDAPVNIHWVEAKSAQAEANAICAYIYETIKLGKTIELVSHDRALVRRLVPRLEHLGIEFDDSAGRPVALSPSAIFAALWLEACAHQDAVSVAAFLGHPFCARLADRAEHLKSLRVYEARVLRGSTAQHIWPKETNDDKVEAILPWMVHWSAFFSQSRPAAQDLRSWLQWHLNSLKTATGVTEGWGALGGVQNGDLELFDAMEALKNTVGETKPLSFFDYQNLWRSWLNRLPALRNIRNPNAKLQIVGKFEARTEPADCVIFAALNEGQWPDAEIPDMWLNRDMRRALDLETPERFIGLSALDFMAGFSAKELVLTRATQSGDTPNVESRFLTRLKLLMRGASSEYLKAAFARGEQWLELGEEFDRPSEYQALAVRPKIALAPDARPHHYSATGIERLLNNPYRAYAERSLRLRDLMPIGSEFGARETGDIVHECFEEFSKTAGTPPAPLDLVSYESLTSKIIENYPLDTLQRFEIDHIFATIQASFLEEENARRQWASTIKTENRHQAAFPFGTLRFELEARFDRMDIDQADNWRLYDYKTGSSSSAYGAKSVDPVRGLQIALTALVVEQNLGHAPDAVGVIRYKGNYPGQFAPLKDFDIADFKDSFQEFLSHYYADDFTFAATHQPAGYDQGFEHLARHGEWLANEAPQRVEVEP